MAKSEVNVDLDWGGKAPPDVDQKDLRANVEAELASFAAQANAAMPEAESVPAPEGAQGADQMLHWALHAASEPAMLKVYLRGLLFTLNEIAIRAGAKPAAKDREPPAFKVRVKAFGKDIVLPIAQATVKAAAEEAFPDETGA